MIGGTGDIFGPEFDAHRLELKTLADYVKLYGKRDLAYEPGARWEYSNYGFLPRSTRRQPDLRLHQGATAGPRQRYR